MPKKASTPEWAQRIKQARLALALKRREEINKTRIAERMGVSDVTVGYWEKGRSEPDIATFVKLAAVLETSPGWLAFGERPIVYEREPDLPDEQPTSRASVPARVGRSR